VLAVKSEYFAKELENTASLVVPFPDPANMFPFILKFMYTNELNVNTIEIVPLTVLSVQLGMNSLSVFTLAFLCSHLISGFRNSWGTIYK